MDLVLGNKIGHALEYGVWNLTRNHTVHCPCGIRLEIKIYYTRRHSLFFCELKIHLSRSYVGFGLGSQNEDL